MTWRDLEHEHEISWLLVRGRGWPGPDPGHLCGLACPPVCLLYRLQEVVTRQPIATFFPFPFNSLGQTHNYIFNTNERTKKNDDDAGDKSLKNKSVVRHNKTQQMGAISRPIQNTTSLGSSQWMGLVSLVPACVSLCSAVDRLTCQWHPSCVAPLALPLIWGK